jgi:integrase/recombinase XerD
MRHVQAILGHKKLETTGVYTPVVIEDPRQVVAHAYPPERAWQTTRRYNRPLRSAP